MQRHFQLKHQNDMSKNQRLKNVKKKENMSQHVTIVTVSDQVVKKEHEEPSHTSDPLMCVTCHECDMMFESEDQLCQHDMTCHDNIKQEFNANIVTTETQFI